MLHFAPTGHLPRVLRSVPGLQYHTADLTRADVDHRVDIQCLPFPDRTWQYILCSHVLDHIPDDIAALREQRVLRPDGLLVLCVPVVESLAQTQEFGEPDMRFLNHVRDYGTDFRVRVAAFFDVTERSPDYWSGADIVRFGLRP